MPQAFNNCRERGGKIRTVSGPDKQYGLGHDEYIHVCILHGKVFPGEKKTKQGPKDGLTRRS